MNGPKNIAASVKARLQNVAGKRGEDFNLLLLRYGIERLLFRLSQSPYADRFLLKGAMLFAIWDEKTHRPTRISTSSDSGLRKRTTCCKSSRRWLQYRLLMTGSYSILHQSGRRKSGKTMLTAAFGCA